MKKTVDAYMGCDLEEELCDSCEHYAKKCEEEPCKSCVISNWEPIIVVDEEEKAKTKCQ